jgi:hypothetical protein
MESGSGVFRWWEMTRRGEKGGEYLWAGGMVLVWYGSPQAMVLRAGVTWRERWGAWPLGRGERGARGVGWDRVRWGARPWHSELLWFLASSTRPGRAPAQDRRDRMAVDEHNCISTYYFHPPAASLPASLLLCGGVSYPLVSSEPSGVEGPN